MVISKPSVAQQSARVSDLNELKMRRRGCRGSHSAETNNMKHLSKTGEWMVASLRDGVATSMDASHWCERCDKVCGFKAHSDREVTSAAYGQRDVESRLGQLRRQLSDRLAARKFAAAKGNGVPAAQQCAAVGVVAAAADQQLDSQQDSRVARKCAATELDQSAQCSAADISGSKLRTQHQDNMQREVAPKWAANQNQCSAGRTVHNSPKGRRRGQRGNGRRLWRRRQLEFEKASGVGASAEDSTEVAESNTEPGQAAQGGNEVSDGADEYGEGDATWFSWFGKMWWLWSWCGVAWCCGCGGIEFVIGAALSCMVVSALRIDNPKTEVIAALRGKKEKKPRAKRRSKEEIMTEKWDKVFEIMVQNGKAGTEAQLRLQV